jgi:hypothetical protein
VMSFPLRSVMFRTTVAHRSSRFGAIGLLVHCILLLEPGAAKAQTSETLVIRGRSQTVYTYGPRGGDPVILSSGDGGDEGIRVSGTPSGHPAGARSMRRQTFSALRIRLF